MKRFGFTMGILAGLGAGLLFAPDEGSVTRMKLRHKINAGKRRLGRILGKDKELQELKEALENDDLILSSETRLKLLQLVNEKQRKYRFGDPVL